MIISDLNALQFWLTPSLPDLEDVINLSVLGVTFNGKNKNGAVQYKPYFHLLQNDDSFPIEIVVDDDTKDYVLSGRNKDGTAWQDFAFVQVSGNHFRAEVDLALYPAIVNDMKFFAVVNDTDGKICAVTDHHKIQTDIQKSILITHNTPDATFDNVLSDVEMIYRIPGTFIHEDYPESTEVESLSDGSIVELTGELKTTRMIHVFPVPVYVHRKIKTILKRKTKQIDAENGGEYWVQEQPYEIEGIPGQTDARVMSEHRRGSVLLTLDGSIKRSIYTT
jgi:hypothetical protein